MNCKCGGKIRKLKDGRLACDRCLRIVPAEGARESSFHRFVFWFCQVLMLAIMATSIALAAYADGRFALLLCSLIIPAAVTAWAVVNPMTGEEYDWVPPPPPHEYEM